jgi:serine protease Do
MVKIITVILAACAFAVAGAFLTANAFPFHWPNRAAPGKTLTAGNRQMTRPNTPEPNEAAVQMPSWAPLVKRVMPTVVNVSVVRTIKNVDYPSGPPQEQPGGSGNGPFGNPFDFGPRNPFGDNPFGLFEHFFGQMPHQFRERGLGSGVIVSPDGYILTNDHVVDHASQIRVTLMDKQEFTARVIGTDPKTDIALIKIKTKEPLPYAAFGDSTTVQIGDPVIAIGNPFGFNLTVTAGIVSAKGRVLGGNYDDFIQTDTSINPGNSGGPLFDTDGKVVGINAAIYSNTGSNEGIGFAIPIDLAELVMNQLREHGRVIRGWLGVEVQQVTPDLAQSFGLPSTKGALVADVAKDGPASRAGIERGDVIVMFDHRAVQDEHELPEMVAQTAIGSSVPIEVIRAGKSITLDAKVAPMKSEELASATESAPPGSSWGLGLQKLTPEIARQLGVANDRGVVIAQVQPDSPADDAGLQRGDVVLEVNHDEVTSPSEFRQLAHRDQEKHSPALLLVERGKATLFTVINPKG